MVITKLYIRNFRNIREAELVFDSSLNIFVGKNAQGKTNLMEAISVCLGGSFRHVRYTQYVPVNVPGAEVFIRLCFRNDDNTGRENIVEYTISNGKPVITYNGLSVSDASKLFGVLKYVVFVPEHLNLIKGAPELRRAYLDDVAVMLQSRSETAQQYPGVRTQGYSGSGAFRAARSLGSGPCQ